MDAAFEAIDEEGTNETYYMNAGPLTLAQVEKLMGKARFADVAGEYVVRAGKPTLIAKYCR